jgi:NAD(P)-dependent dehydrogenase (short-subunit alcohol dehydrogenase family)
VSVASRRRSKPVLKPLSQQTLVITGASSGIGLVTARMAARAGAAVFLISRNGEILRRVCEGIEAQGGRAAFAVADVGDEAQLTAACEMAIARFGGFDTWVNVAGVAIASTLLSTPRDEHERLFRTNYSGVVNGCTLAVDHLRLRGGALITVGSVASEMGTPVLGAYAASKHAVKGFVDSLRIDLIAEAAPISVTLIKPSGIGTPLGEHSANHMGHAVKIPPPPYPPEAVAKAILAAATTTRREITVGGAGAFQMLAARLVPRSSDFLSSFVGPLLVDKTRPPNQRNNLFSAGDDGLERSPFETILPGSLQTALATHRRVAAWSLVALLAAVGATVLSQRERRRRLI